MNDLQIIELYLDRNESAIQETDTAYGKKLYTLADRIVQNREDAQENVNDTYMKAWNTIPPQRPAYLFAYLAKICRRFSFGTLDRKNAAKRRADIVSLSSELESCIPDNRQDSELEAAEIGRLLNNFLENLNPESRLIFLRRYWYADSVEQIARRCKFGESAVKTRLHRIRTKLRLYLESEGITL